MNVVRDVTKDARFGWKEYYVGTVNIKCLNDESHASKKIKTYATIFAL